MWGVSCFFTLRHTRDTSTCKHVHQLRMHDKAIFDYTKFGTLYFHVFYMYVFAFWPYYKLKTFLNSELKYDLLSIEYAISYMTKKLRQISREKHNRPSNRLIPCQRLVSC